MITMMFWLMWVAMIAFWVLLGWVIYVLVTGGTRRASDSARGGPQPDDAHRILDERLARGEIDAEEYRRLRAVLDGDADRRSAGTGSRQ
jgi:putative membrane protein